MELLKPCGKDAGGSDAVLRCSHFTSSLNNEV
jgi:hypothetical protein